MGNYCNQPDMVRVDVFKPSGKWVETRAVLWHQYTGEIGDIFARVIRSNFGTNFIGYKFVCLEPYHEHAHPLMQTM